LVFTYVCNTMDVPSLVANQKIYFPQVVRVPMPSLAPISHSTIGVP
jgi:hypothetical protein